MVSDASVGDLRSVLAVARMDCAATLSSQVDGVIEHVVLRPARAIDPAWWSAALAGPARELDDGWVRRAGPAVRRARAIRALRHPGTNVAEITHVPLRAAGPVLASAAVAVLPAPRRRAVARAGRPARVRAPGADVARGTRPGLMSSGSVLPPGGLASGSLLAGLAGAWRTLPAAGPGLLLVLAGLVLLAGAGTAAWVRAVRAARAREIALRVRTAVLAAADRELICRILDAERLAGTPPPVTGVRAVLPGAGAGRAA